MGRRVSMAYKQISQVRVSRLAAALALLVLLYILYTWLRGPSPAPRTSLPQTPRLNPTDRDLVAQIRTLHDTRPAPCHARMTSHTSDVSIVMTYHNLEWYDLKLTIESFLKFTPHSQYKQVLLMDDGSNLPGLSQNVSNFLSNRKFQELLVLRSEARDGEAASRFKASRAATGAVLVFANSQVIFNEGWLPPLLQQLSRSPQSLAVPHADNFLHGFKFFPLSPRLVNVFSLTLSVLHLESPEQVAEDGAIMSPVMRGDVFAVNSEYYNSLGDHDESFQDGGGHDLELSLRTWLCGGEIKKALCSHVAIRDALAPVKVESAENARRLAELWLGSFSAAVYQQRDDVTPQMNTREANLLRARSVHLRKSLHCKSIDWYLSNVALDMIIPSDAFLYFGKFRDYSGKCLKNNNGALELGACDLFIYHPEMLFELSTAGHLSNSLQCVTAPSRDVITLSPCIDGTHAQWSYNERHELQCAAWEGMCLEKLQGGELGLRPCANEHQIPQQVWTHRKY